MTCKNRFYQIRKTLPKNLKDNYRHKSIIEFVLVDFDSSDGLRTWILTNFKKELNQNYLKFFHTKELAHWHMSIAKNTAHLYASGEILVNLDCDNYTGRNGGYFLLNCFNKYAYPIVIHQFSGQLHDGSFGRISARRGDFHKIGGYDESFGPMAYQDIDLLHRIILNCNARYLGIKNSNFNRALANTKELGTKYCITKLNHIELHKHNMKISKQNISKGKFVANKGDFGIRKGVYDHKGIEISL